MPHRTDGGLLNLWERADIEQGLLLAGFARVLGEHELPLIVPEIGAFLANGGDDREREVEWLSNTLGVLGSWNVGYVGWAWRSDEQLDHGMLHEGVPNEAGEALLEALPSP
jgi:hypothetical protein